MARSRRRALRSSRFVNAAGGEVAVNPDFLPPLRLGVTVAERVGAYAVVDQVAKRSLDLSVQRGAHTAHATLSVAPGGYVTVLVMPVPGGAVAAVPVVDSASYNPGAGAAGVLQRGGGLLRRRPRAGAVRPGGVRGCGARDREVSQRQPGQSVVARFLRRVRRGGLRDWPGAERHGGGRQLQRLADAARWRADRVRHPRQDAAICAMMHTVAHAAPRSCSKDVPS